MRSRLYVCFAIVLMAAGCSEHFTNQPHPNLPPETFVALRPDSTLRRTISQQQVHWWGVDPDGFVAGYYWSLDSLNWSFTTKNDSLFLLKLSGTDTTYSFYVKAVDNSGNVDLTPASLKYPIMNSPPTASFILNTDVPESTYTVATFQWKASDIDGIETIQNILYALDDTLNPASWRSIPGETRQLTLTKTDGLTEGRHVFYMRARDVAGAMSPIVRMPKDTNSIWYVKEPKGDFLIVDDYAPLDNAHAVFSSILDTLMGGRLKAVDVWDIKTGASNVSRGKYVPALINPTMVQTMKLFKYIFWYSDAPSLDIAAAALPEFKKAGGKYLLAWGFQQFPPDLSGIPTYAPIDSVGPYFYNILLMNDSVYAADPTYPVLIRDAAGAIYQFPRGVKPNVTAKVIYQMQPKPSRWAGQPIMGVKDGDPANVVFVSLVLHRFGTPPGKVAALFRRVFEGEFGVH